MCVSIESNYGPPSYQEGVLPLNYSRVWDILLQQPQKWYSECMPKLLFVAICIGVLISLSIHTQAASAQTPGQYFKVQVVDEIFYFYSTNPTTIEQATENFNGGNAYFPSGILRRGKTWYNENYTWYLDPQETNMAPLAMEACDGRPSYVEGHTDYWLETLGRYCPWHGKIVGIGPPSVTPHPIPSQLPFTDRDIRLLLKDYLEEHDVAFVPMDGKVNALDFGFLMNNHKVSDDGGVPL